MTYDWPLYYSLFLALWSAVIGGTFSAFSEFIMKALSKIAPEAGIEAMQQINRDVIRTQFVAGILSVAVFSVLFAIYSIFAFDGAARVTLVIATLVYVPSVFLMTIFGNVPMNDKLDRQDAVTSDGQAYWTTYVRNWNRLNHARSLGSILTAGLYIVAAITLIHSGQV